MNPIDEYISLETRRQFLGNSAKGLGLAALSSILGNGLMGKTNPSSSTGSGFLSSTHFRPKAKRGIYLFMSGAPSQLDMYDFKPAMRAMFDKDLPDSVRKGQRLTTMTSAPLHQEDRRRHSHREVRLDRGHQSRSSNHLYSNRKPKPGATQLRSLVELRSWQLEPELANICRA